jgi:hypothetical protein
MGRGEYATPDGKAFRAVWVLWAIGFESMGLPSPERLARVRNPDLFDTAWLGRAAVPLDLMTYLPEDQQPSTFFLNENVRQHVLVVLNWTERLRDHAIALSDLGLKSDSTYAVTDILSGRFRPDP